MCAVVVVLYCRVKAIGKKVVFVLALLSCLPGCFLLSC